jgi:type II secretory pathway pseudopilin PulG
MRKTMRYIQRGFSLLEALFAITLLFMAIGTFLSLFPYALQKNEHDALYLQAVDAGQQYLDALRSAAEADATQPPIPVIAIDAGYSVVDNTTKNQSPGTFAISGVCATPAPLSTLRDCTVTVQWPEVGQTRSYSAESFATQQVP